MNSSQLKIEDHPSTEDLDFLEHQINAYNIAQVGAYDGRELAIFVRDAQNQIVAGLAGYTWAGFCEVRFLWVHQSLRGQGYGTCLLHATEQEARDRGCSLIILSSYSFQAPQFYLKHGYEIAGQIDDCPPGHTNFYLKKRLL